MPFYRLEVDGSLTRMVLVEVGPDGIEAPPTVPPRGRVHEIRVRGTVAIPRGRVHEIRVWGTAA